MSASKIASFVALLGGAAWVVHAVLTWGSAASGGTPDWSALDWGVLHWVGLAGLVVALAAGGYALVAKAPIWLRAVVTLATAVLGYLIWVLIEDSIGSDYLTALVGGIVLLLGGVLGLLRAEPTD